MTGPARLSCRSGVARSGATRSGAALSGTDTVFDDWYYEDRAGTTANEPATGWTLTNP